MKNIAIITGASSGMGREFVRLLDGLFDECWGIGLGQEALDRVKEETKTPFIGFDLDLTKEESFDVIRNKLDEEKPNVKFLANCSGFGKFGRYDEIDVKDSANMVDLNCKALLQMTEYVLPYMSEGGRIVEIASVAGFQPIPYMAVYGASKAFVVSYSRALNQELKSRKIKITCVCPFWTKAIKDSKKGKELSICGFIARSQVRLVNILPKKLVMATWISQQKLKKKYKNR